MKKLISMMLMLCAVITFSACSSDDDGPSNPVSNPTIPQSAKIGSEVTIQGTGFAAGQTLWLVPVSQPWRFLLITFCFSRKSIS